MKSINNHNTPGLPTNMSAQSQGQYG